MLVAVVCAVLFTVLLGNNFIEEAPVAVRPVPPRPILRLPDDGPERRHGHSPLSERYGLCRQCLALFPDPVFLYPGRRRHEPALWLERSQSRRRRQPHDLIHPYGLHPRRGDEPAHGTEPVGPLFRSFFPADLGI